ncbi:biliverdin-producing heme oxygenase [Rhodopseudomonas sp. HC1]|uniref:biliverdin-producing heme oxygenase n=1 Tax=Rhodopseudomonas infernalis TaxID=2897386 RepID=UPI001EE8D549|nr:biliverdin-producing heme oxygenase [Rhodopseudomonas infernalis]MCG6206729.1 biliverdin-producing heme oxygenase [Rhodopseudomonas infernalis]
MSDGSVPEASRARRLKMATHATHERLDTAIMARRPFANRERYALFLEVQHRFHRDVDPLYRSAALGALLPDLAQRRRLGLVEQDLCDLGIATDPSGATPTSTMDDQIDVPSALGWLYVAEGSNLGASFLLKQAAKLGLSETFGARHLAAAPDGRALHWRGFVAAFDAVPLSHLQEEGAIAGARAAFMRVQALVSELLALPAAASAQEVDG